VTSTVKWGILGTSFISQVMADAIIAEGQSTLHSVAGRSAESRHEFSKKNNIERAFSDFDALIEDPDVDVVYIALPNHIHHDYVCKAANAGKAIVCEKSLSIDMDKTDLALASVTENGVFFLEGLMYLCHPLARTITNLIHSGVVGDVKSVHGDYCAAISQFVNPKSMGVLYNLGCYPVSLMHLLMQSAFGDEVFNQVSVQASGRRGSDGNICESSAVFSFANGVQANIHTAEDYGLYSSFRVLGSAGSLEIISNPWLPEAVGSQIRVTPYEGESELIEVPAAGDGFYYQVKLVRETLEQGALEVQRPAVRPRDSRAIMALLSAWASVLPN
jgi:predicted dehydrogenase